MDPYRPYVPRMLPYLSEQDAFRTYMERHQRHARATQGPPTAGRAASHAAALAAEAVVLGPRHVPIW